MKQTHSITEITGLARNLVISTTLLDSWDFSKMVAASDVIENITRGTSGTVVSAADGSVVGDVEFAPGDAYIITLATAWTATVYDSDGVSMGPVSETVCKMCGFETKKKELDVHEGRCKVCYDSTTSRSKL